MTSITPSPEMGLLPCPFCGGAVKLETYSADYKRIEFCVMCHECDFCTAEGLTVEETVKRWNTRAKPALSCPDGFRLVPVEPTSEQLDAIVEECRAAWGVGNLPQRVPMMAKHEWRERAKPFYRAMLAASPVSLQVKDSK